MEFLQKDKDICELIFPYFFFLFVHNRYFSLSYHLRELYRVHKQLWRKSTCADSTIVVKKQKKQKTKSPTLTIIIFTLLFLHTLYFLFFVLFFSFFYKICICIDYLFPNYPLLHSICSLSNAVFIFYVAIGIESHQIQERLFEKMCKILFFYFLIKFFECEKLKYFKFYY